MPLRQTPFPISGWRLGTMVVPERSDAFPNSRHRVVGGVSGGTEQASRLRAVRWEKPKGGKAPAAQSRSSLSRKENTAPKNYDCDENDCAPFAPGSPTRPTGVRARFQSEAAAGVPFAAATPKRQAPVWPSRGEVATMRGRNKMRFSAPTREPPGGRPSRGAKLKGRGCTRQRYAATSRTA